MEVKIFINCYSRSSELFIDHDGDNIVVRMLRMLLSGLFGSHIYLNLEWNEITLPNIGQAWIVYFWSMYNSIKWRSTYGMQPVSTIEDQSKHSTFWLVSCGFWISFNQSAAWDWRLVSSILCSVRHIKVCWNTSVANGVVS
jgi:hypothetical protein